MKKQFAFILLTLLTISFVSGSSVYALTIDIFDATNSASILNWKKERGGNTQVIEDFDSVVDGWYKKLLYPDSKIGNFTANGNPGTGGSSYNNNNNPDSDDPYFRILSGGNHGRDGTKYLDSSDITELDLSINLGKWELTNLFFWIKDPSDIKADTIITSASTEKNSDSKTISNPQINGSEFFVGIYLNDDEKGFIKTINWSTNGDTNDGYALEDFSTVTEVPEPATMWLFGFGLLGLAGLGRQKKN